MKIAVANVGLQGFRDSESNAARIEALTSLLQSAAKRNLDALIMPAGFLTVAAQDQLSRIVDKCSDAISPFRVPTIFGVDVLRKSEAALRPQSGINLPYYVYASTNAGIIGPWQQRSIQAHEEHLTKDDENRQLTIDGEQTGILVGGEIFNRRLRRSFIDDPKIKTVIVPAHVSEGRWNAIVTTANVFLRDGKLDNLLISLHISKPVKHRVWSRPDSQQASITVPANGQAPWIDAAVFKL